MLKLGRAKDNRLEKIRNKNVSKSEIVYTNNDQIQLERLKMITGSKRHKRKTKLCCIQ